MRSVDVSLLFVVRCNDKRPVTNLSLNKLVYLAQVESLKTRDKTPLFDDAIEAWEYGPVEPAVYRLFRSFGRNPIRLTPEQEAAAENLPDHAKAIVDSVIEKYGSLPAFDLVDITHRKGGAWRKKYIAGQNVLITTEDIIDSDDYALDVDLGRTFSASIRNVENTWPNALRMLQDA